MTAAEQRLNQVKPFQIVRTDDDTGTFGFKGKARKRDRKNKGGNKGKSKQDS